MNFIEFRDTLISELEDIYPNVQITNAIMNKNNGVYYNGLNFREEGINISPVIYIDEYYKKFCNGCSLYDIVDAIRLCYETSRANNDIDVSLIENFNNVKSKVFIKAVNFEKNVDLLNTVPYVKVEDIAMIFYLILYDSELGQGSVLIKNELLKTWNITKEELTSCALENESKDGYDFLKLEDLLYEIYENKIEVDLFSGEDKDSGLDISLPMYILTNEKRTYGASKIFINDVLDEIWDQLRSDYYIIPSSIHECIIVPKSAMVDPVHLEEMLKEVNRTELIETEFLSDDLYFYDREYGILTRTFK